MSDFKIWYRSQPVALRMLITINVVIYVAWMLLLVRLAPSVRFFFEHLALNPELPGVLFEPWQVLTYNFLHLGRGFGGLLHIGFNMLWLYWIGKGYEQMHGSHKLLALYVIGGVGGGLLSVLAYSVMPGNPVIYGASASVLAVLTAVAILYPRRKIALLFIGTVRLIYLVIGFLAIDILLMGTSGTAVMAHLGGAASGFLFARAERSGVDLSSWARLFFSGTGRSPRSPSSRSSSGGFLHRLFGSSSGQGSRREGAGQRSRQRGRTPREERAEMKARRNERDDEINRILDKISAEGYEALSEEEKRILYEAGGQG